MHHLKTIYYASSGSTLLLKIHTVTVVKQGLELDRVGF